MQEPTTYAVTGGPAPLIIGARGLEAILQNVRLILTTLAHQVVLDRKFAWAGEMLDQPSPYDAQRQLHRVALAIETYEPRVEVVRVSLEAIPASETMDGGLRPKVTLRVRPGVL